MKRTLSVSLLLLALAAPLFAQDNAVRPAPPSVTINGQSLKLNGTGVRDNSVYDAFAGSLYAPKSSPTPEALIEEPGDKLLRLDILKDKVEKERIMGAFEEGFIKDSPDFATSPDAKRFLSLFKVDFYKGDKVELLLGGDGTVAASHNGKPLGSLKSSLLVRGILKSWFGDKPAAGERKP
ncbi:MAG TPA: chalcone isomerase family protein [Candidatus Deferrimicrobiaceae bacterium]|jgi:hypothetical protein